MQGRRRRKRSVSPTLTHPHHFENFACPPFVMSVSHPRVSTPAQPAKSWAPTWLMDPPRLPRGFLVAIVVALVLVIGWLDYVASIWFSLQIFYLLPIILSVAWLGWKEGCATVVLCVAVRMTGDYADDILSHINWVAVLWNRFIDLSVSCLLVGVVHTLISLQRELEQRVEQRTAALEQAIHARNRLQSELLDVSARERNSLGHELHDDICQHLVGTALAAKVLAQRLRDQDGVGAREAQAIVNWIEEGANKTRQLARGLLLAAIDPAKLGEKLSELAAEGSTTDVPCRFRQEGDVLVADAGVAAQLFRIAQEAMRNALRHAAPRHVQISLSGDTQAICLMVEDDGRGLPPPEERGTGIGLRIMSHRAAFIGGRLSIVPTSGQGTRIICHLPRRPAAA